MNEHSTVTLRTATALDAEALTGFLGELGIVMPEGSDAMTAHWRNLWVDNPAMVYHDKGIAPGWVLEDGGEIKGFFGNVPLVYWLGDVPVTTSCASAWAVMPDYRAETSRLCDA